MGRYLTGELPDRIVALAAIGEQDECWPWRGTILPNGYGQISFRGVRYLAHRAAWMVFRGPIPDGLQVLHSCDNPPCCNPAHLRLGTQKDNIRDAISRGRYVNGMTVRPETALKGQEHPNARLTEDDVRAIRRRRAEGAMYREIGHEFGITKATACQIALRKAWKHVT